MLALQTRLSQRGRRGSIQLHSSGARGIAFFVTFFGLLIVTAASLGIVFQAEINSNHGADKLVFYASKAGLEEARDRMRTNAGTGITISANLPTALPGTPNGVLYITNPASSETVSPWLPTVNNSPNKYFDDEICLEVGCVGTQVPATPGWYITPALTAHSSYAANPVLPYKWVRINLKTNRSASGTSNVLYVNGSNSPTSANYQVCWNGTNEFASATGCVAPNKPVYMLTALALTASGARRMTQYEVTQDQLNLSFPAALTFDGYGDALYPPHSNVYYVDGNDHAGCSGAAVQPPKPAIGVPDNVDINTVIDDLPNNRLSHYVGRNPAPDVENVSSHMAASLQTVSSLEALLATIKNNATHVVQGPASGLPSYGSPCLPIIAYVNGDLTLSGSITGYGLLVVTGTYNAGGNVGWRGIVLVVGQGRMVVNGGGNNQYTGAVLIARTRDTNGKLLPSLGGTNLNWSTGGGNGVYYSSGCIGSASTLPTYRVLASRETAR